MNIQVNIVNIQYQDGDVKSVRVHFSGQDENKEININGYIPLTAKEYEGNEAIPTLTTLVQTKVIEKLQSPAE